MVGALVVAADFDRPPIELVREAEPAEALVEFRVEHENARGLIRNARAAGEPKRFVEIVSHRVGPHRAPVDGGDLPHDLAGHKRFARTLECPKRLAAAGELFFRAALHHVGEIGEVHVASADAAQIAPPLELREKLPAPPRLRRRRDAGLF